MAKTKKVTLSVPKDLYDEMQEWKDSFNYSQIFKDEVRRKIRLKEEFQQRLREDVNIEQIIERLREEKKEAEANCYSTGRERGLQWAKAASYGDLSFTIRLIDRGVNFGTDPGLRATQLEKEMAENPYLNYEAWCSRVYDKMNDEFLRGWQESVWEFWKEVRDKL